MQEFILVFTIYCLSILFYLYLDGQLLKFPHLVDMEIYLSNHHSRHRAIEFLMSITSIKLLVVELSWILQNEPIPAIVSPTYNDSIESIFQQFPKKN